MDKSSNLDELLAEINRRLPFEQQMQKDDPMYSGVVLNKVALDTYVQHTQKKLDEALQQFLQQYTTVSDQQIARAEAITDGMISKSGNNIAKQLETLIQQGEERLHKAGNNAEIKIRWASRLAWISAILVALTACAIVGSWLGTVVFDQFIHHTAPPFHHQAKTTRHL